MIEIASVCSTDAVSTVYNLRVAGHQVFDLGNTCY